MFYYLWGLSVAVMALPPHPEADMQHEQNPLYKSLLLSSTKAAGASLGGEKRHMMHYVYAANEERSGKNEQTMRCSQEDAKSNANLLT